MKEVIGARIDGRIEEEAATVLGQGWAYRISGIYTPAQSILHTPPVSRFDTNDASLERFTIGPSRAIALSSCRTLSGIQRPGIGRLDSCVRRDDGRLHRIVIYPRR